MRPEKNEAPGAGGRRGAGYGNVHRHSIQAIEFLVIVRGDISRVWGVYQHRGKAFLVARDLRCKGLDAEVKAVGQPTQLEIDFKGGGK